MRGREHVASVGGIISNPLHSSAEPLPKENWQEHAQESNQTWNITASGKWQYTGEQVRGMDEQYFST